MASQYRIERDRGTKEASQQLAVLRERWPLAFPVKDDDVRPLAITAASEIAAVMGWSRPYTLGVLRNWKMTAAYCQAILRHDQRIALDGAPAQPVGDEAKDLAAKQLARRAALKPVARPGDLWQLGRHLLVCGDATERADVEMLLGGAQPHLMVTDPPYGVNYDADWRSFCR